VLIQQADVGQRQAQMFATAMQEGTKNYLTQKQIDVEKQKAEAQAGYNQELAANRKSVEQDARDRAIREDFKGELDKVGPGAEWRVFIDNKPMAMKFFGTYGEDKDHTQALYDSALKIAMGQGSPTSFFGAGAVGVGQPAPQGQVSGATIGQPVPAPSVATPAGIPSTSPLAPFAAQAGGVPPVGAGQTPVPSPSPMAQAANPQSSPTAGMGGPTSPIAKIAAQPSQPSQPGSTAVSVTQITQGLPQNAKTDAANSGLAKIAAYASGRVDANVTITPPEQAAIKAVNKPNIQIMRDSTITKELLAENGPVAEEVLKRATDFLNNAIQDPTYLKWLQEGGASMTKEEAASYGGVLKDDVQLQALLEKTVKDQALRDNAFLNTSLKAQADIDRFQLTYDALKIRAKNTKDTEANQLVHMYQLSNMAMHDYVAASDSLRLTFKKTDGTFDEEAFNTAFQQELARPTSPITQSLNLAVQDWAAAQQLDKSQIPTITSEFVDRYTAGIKLPFLAEMGSATAPYIPSPATGGIPTPQPGAPQPGAAPRPGTPPAPVTPPPGGLTPAQKSRVIQGLPPGAP